MDLHELIYGRPAEEEEVVPESVDDERQLGCQEDKRGQGSQTSTKWGQKSSAKTSRSRRRDATAAIATANKEQQEDKEPNPSLLLQRRVRFDQLYNSSEHQDTNAVVHNQVLERSKPKRKVTEERHEWNNIRRRWRKRRTDLRQEEDVGGAIARQYQQTKKQLKRKRKRQEATKKEKVSDSDQESSLDEQERILSQITVTNDTPDPSPAIAPQRHADSMSAWEYGLSAPTTTVLSLQSTAHTKLPKRKRGRQAKPDKKEAAVTIGNERSLEPHKQRASLYPTFPYSRAVMGDSQKHLHTINSVRLGTRVLMQTNQWDHCWIPILWKRPPLAHFDRYLGCTERAQEDATHCGQALMLFLQCKWKDRVEMAHTLGILPGATLPNMTASQTQTFIMKRCKKKSIGETGVWVGEDGTASLLETCGYHHVPGTCPPVPQFPLDLPNIVFGPLDRYHHVHHRVFIDESVYKLTLSKLLLHKSPQCQSILDTIVNVHQSKFEKLLKHIHSKGVLEIPLANLAKAVAYYSSFVANNLLVDTVRASTEHLFGFLEQHLDNNGLQMFPDLHVPFGIVRIAKLLPEPAIELLSNSLSAPRTPFDAMRETLEYLEQRDHLVNGMIDDNNNNFIGTGLLEYEMHKASETFAKCKSRDPTEVDYHCWYLGTLASSLLLCSGNKIGSGARLHPSYFRYVKDDDFFSSKQTRFLKHEVRRKLGKFQELRIQTIQAFCELCELAIYQKSNRGYRAVTSFLEWKQVMGLFLGPNASNRFFQSVRLLHETCQYRWTLTEHSNHPVDGMKENKETRLEALAIALERDPSNIDNWRTLVSELGTLERSTRESDNTDSQKWWGTGREWWYESLLLTDISLDYAQMDEMEHIRPQLVKALGKTASKSRAFSEANTNPRGLENDVEDAVLVDSLRWMDELAQQDPGNENQKLPNLDSRRQTFGDRLPTSLYEQAAPLEQEKSPPGPLLESVPLELEMLVSKAVLIGHLFSTSHRGIGHCIVRLLWLSWSRNKRTIAKDYGTCLRALRDAGIEVLEQFDTAVRDQNQRLYDSVFDVNWLSLDEEAIRHRDNHHLRSFF